MLKNWGILKKVAYTNEENFYYANLQSLEYKSALELAYPMAWTIFHVGSQASGNEEWGVDYLADIPTYIKHNVQFGYIAPTETKVTFGINNLTDEKAPSYYDGFRDYRDSSWSLYDQTGRSMYLRVEQQF